MATFTVRPEGIIRQPALTMPGNATGSEAACTSLTASQIRTLLGLGTTSDVTFDIVRATTSVQTPLVNNASAALTLGSATYGVTVPGAAVVSGDISMSKTSAQGYITTYSPSGLKYLSMWATNAGNAYLQGGDSIYLQSGTSAISLSTDLWLQPHTNGSAYVFRSGVNSTFDVYNSGSPSHKYTRLTHDGTNGILSTSAGNLNLVPAGGTVAVTGGITASTAISAGATVNGLPGIGGTTFLSGKSGTFEFSVQDYSGGNGYIGTSNGTVNCITAYTTTSDPRAIYGTTSNHDVMLWRQSVQKLRVYSTHADFANIVKASEGLLSCANILYTGSNGAAGSCEVASTIGTGPVVLWTEYGLGVRGCLGYTAGSTTLSYRAAGYSMTTGTEVFTIGSTGNVSCAGITASGVVSHGAYTVATLPAAGSNAGKMAQVTDSNVAASGNYGATVAAGGANRVKVFSDGTNWVIA